MTSITHKLARTMLADRGIGLIWKLHSDAATAARIGNHTAALALSEFAETASENGCDRPARSISSRPSRWEPGQSLTYKCPGCATHSAIISVSDAVALCPVMVLSTPCGGSVPPLFFVGTTGSGSSRFSEISSAARVVGAPFAKTSLCRPAREIREAADATAGADDRATPGRDRHPKTAIAVAGRPKRKQIFLQLIARSAIIA
jgi:hypothetical protein